MIENRIMLGPFLRNVKNTPTRANFLISLFILILPGISLGNSVEDATTKQAKAYADFYSGLKALGNNPPQDKIVDLQKNTVFPAQVEVIKAVNASGASMLTQVRQTIYDQLKKRFSDAFIPKQLLEGEKAKVVSRNISERKSSNGKEEFSAPPTSPRDEPGLDGSKIPKELEFKGKAIPATLK